MANIGVVGWGHVGSAVGKGFAVNPTHKIRWFDKFKKSPSTLSEVVKLSDFVFLCLPTPMLRDYTGIDMSIVTAVAEEVAQLAQKTKAIVVFKSTVLPGTVRGFVQKYQGIKFAMNPEFLTQKNAFNDFLNPTRTVIGAEDANTGKKIKALYQTILPKNQKYFITDTVSAEIIKYMSNLMLASKIILANEFYFISKELGGKYEDIRQAVEADLRIGTFLKVPGWDGDFGFGQACFPKDIVGLIGFAKTKKIDVSVLEAVWAKNLKVRKKREWERMDNAFGIGSSKSRKGKI